MSKNPFVVLGISKDSTQAEVKDAYERLRDEYRMQIHLEGEEGNRAAKKLAELEDAYREVMDTLASGATVDSSYGYVQSLLHDKKYSEAQAALDRMSERGAEWHFLQAGVYHAKGWSYEAKSQLEMAINMDPANTKYRETMDRLLHSENKATGTTGANSDAKSGAQGGQKRSYNTYEQMQANGRQVTACDCCQGLICADCCCECMGGDLIRCC